MQMPFGKHRGKELSNVPDDYLAWVLDNCERISPTLRDAIRARLGLTPVSEPNPIDDALLNRWYRTLVMKYHPDRGGSVGEMQAVNEANDLLRTMLRGGR
jgi:F420-0:gamma-glutamyl ligase-like protein